MGFCPSEVPGKSFFNARVFRREQGSCQPCSGGVLVSESIYGKVKWTARDMLVALGSGLVSQIGLRFFRTSFRLFSLQRDA